MSAPVSNADLAPTLLDLAGAAIPPELARPIDGVSQRDPACAARPADPGRVIPIEGRDNVARSRHGWKVALLRRRAHAALCLLRVPPCERRDAGRGIEAAALGAGRTIDRELYDLERDPYELANAARQPAIRAARARWPA